MLSAVASKAAATQDPTWEHGIQANPNNKTKIVCNYCKKVCNGGVTRFKKHLAGVKGDVAPCALVPEDVRTKFLTNLEATRKKKNDKEEALHDLRSGVHVHAESEDDIDVCAEGIKLGKKRARENQVGPLDKFCKLTPEEALEKRDTLKQSTLKKEERAKTIQYIARWMYRTGVPFNTINDPSFDLMLEAIGSFGRNLKKPSPYELSEICLKNEVESTKTSLKEHKRKWISTGCFLLTDIWTDAKSRSLMNLVVHCELGASFIKSIDSFDTKHDGSFIFKWVETCIEKIGPSNVVQVVTDSASNNMAVAKLLHVKRPNIYWTSCATHIINLMLSDIGKRKEVKTVISKARTVTVFLYSHTYPLSLMRKYTNQRDLVRPGATRFATSFLSLESMLSKKRELREMFYSAEWEGSRWSHDEKGLQASSIILDASFWTNVEYVINIFEPLVHVLRRVDGDAPAMGYLYGDLERAKKQIKVILEEDEKNFLPIWKIIDTRWDKKLKTPLHKAGCYFNPGCYYENKMEIDAKGIFMDGVMDCLLKIYNGNATIQDAILDQLTAYSECQGHFGREIAKRTRTTFHPAKWWRTHGTETPELTTMAVRILSLTCSSSACERNWSAFEMIHTKKRNRLGTKILNDLVYVKFNACLEEKRAAKKRDPLAVNDFSEGKVSKWIAKKKTQLSQKEKEYEEHWAAIGQATGAGEPERRLRSRSNNENIGSSSRNKGKEVEKERDIDEEEFESSESDDGFEDGGSGTFVEPEINLYDSSASSEDDVVPGYNALEFEDK